MSETQSIAAPNVSPDQIVLSLKNEAMDKIKGSADTVRQAVISQLVAGEIKRRVDLLTGALGKRDEAAKELEAIKPDVVAFTESGAKASENWSKDQLKRKTAATKKLGKIDKAISMALTQANFEEVKKVAAGQVSTDDKDETTDSN